MNGNRTSLNSSAKSFDVRRVWHATETALHKMSPKQHVQTLVEAGILTAKGTVTKPCAKAIRSAK